MQCQATDSSALLIRAELSGRSSLARHRSHVHENKPLLSEQNVHFETPTFTHW